MTSEVVAALAGSVILGIAHALAPALTRVPERYLATMKSFSGGTGLAYVVLYLLFELAKYGAPKIHALLPLGPEPMETLFILLLGALSASYLLQAHLEKSDDLQDDYLGFAVFFLVYNVLVGAGMAEEARTESLPGLAFYVTALGLHLLFNDLFLHQLNPGAHDWRWRTALAAMPVFGCAIATGFSMPEGVLYAMLAVVGGSTIISVVRHELPSRERFRPAAFLAGVLVYAILILATWRF